MVKTLQVWVSSGEDGQDDHLHHTFDATESGAYEAARSMLERLNDDPMVAHAYVLEVEPGSAPKLLWG